MVELGALVLGDGVLDGQLVEAELVGQLGELLVGRGAEVDPHEGVGLGEVLGHVGHREVLGLEHALAVQPRVLASAMR